MFIKKKVVKFAIIFKSTILLMKTILNFSIFQFFLIFTINSQIDFNHSIGMTILHGNYVSSSNGVTNYSFSKTFVGLTYNPRIDYLLNDNLSLGLSAYPTYCIGSNVSINQDKRGFAFESPLLMQINFGNHSSENSDSRFGGFLGGGLNYGIYSSFPNNSSLSTAENQKVTSLCFQLGFTQSKFGKDIGIRLEYNKPLNLELNQSFTVIGLGVFYDLY